MKPLLSAQGLGRAPGPNDLPTTRSDPRYGHQVLDPLPSDNEIDQFYQRQYYRLIDAGARAEAIARERRGGNAADEQRLWQRETLHRDVVDAIREYARGPHVLDVGCGMGALLDDLVAAGFTADGLDLAPESQAVCAARGRHVYQGSLLDLEANGALQRDYDAVVLIDVLYQTRDPAANLMAAARLLNAGGIVIVRSGNDFNLMQLAAEAAGIPRWWVTAPDHLHYLNYDVIEAMMSDAGLTVVLKQSDFPMEMFLLMGEDYTQDPDLGAACHQKRMAFELNLPVRVRRALYAALAEINLGRCAFMVGRKRA